MSGGKPFLFQVEPARSGAAGCKGCKEKIGKDALRVGVISIDRCNKIHPEATGPWAVTTEQEVGACYNDHAGWQWRWFHVDCFKFEKYPVLKDTSCFVPAVHGFASFSQLSAAHKKVIENKLKLKGGAEKEAVPKAKAAPKGKAKAAPAAKAQAKAAPEAEAAALSKKRKAPGDDEGEAPPALKAARGGATAGVALAGKTLVFTGALSLNRKEASEAAKAAGAMVLSDISKNAQILVAGPGAGSKLAKAESLGIEVWDEEKFKEACGL